MISRLILFLLGVGLIICAGLLINQIGRVNCPVTLEAIPYERQQENESVIVISDKRHVVVYDQAQSRDRGYVQVNAHAFYRSGTLKIVSRHNDAINEMHTTSNRVVITVELPGDLTLDAVKRIVFDDGESMIEHVLR